MESKIKRFSNFHLTYSSNTHPLRNQVNAMWILCLKQVSLPSSFSLPIPDIFSIGVKSLLPPEEEKSKDSVWPKPRSKWRKWKEWKEDKVKSSTEVNWWDLNLVLFEEIPKEIQISVIHCSHLSDSHTISFFIVLTHILFNLPLPHLTSLAVISAPAFNSAFIQWICPFIAAKCKGVWKKEIENKQYHVHFICTYTLSWKWESIKGERNVFQSESLPPFSSSNRLHLSSSRFIASNKM